MARKRPTDGVRKCPFGLSASPIPEQHPVENAGDNREVYAQGDDPRRGSDGQVVVVRALGARRRKAKPWKLTISILPEHVRVGLLPRSQERPVDDDSSGYFPHAEPL